MTLDEVVALCKRRGFVFQSSEIYGGLGSTYDYGHYGVLLKNNVKGEWWRAVLQERDDMVALDAAILSTPAPGRPRATWRASPTRWSTAGPASSASAPTSSRTPSAGESRPNQPGESDECDLTEPRQFNLMFETFMGPVRDDAARVYLRPETAQGIFVNFKNVLQFARKKPPFGIAQIGKAFRNEITPGNFIFRTREFEMMEIEYFVPPDEADDWHRRWMEDRMRWHTDLGIRPDHLQLRKHGPTSCRTTPRRPRTSSTCSRWAGPSWRGSPTAATSTSHATPSSPARSSSTSIRKGEAYVPYVIEPSLGVDRSLLAFMVDAYDTEEVEGRKRTVLRLHPRLAPVKAAVLPLVSKAGMPDKAREIYEELRRTVPAEYDEGGSIGTPLPPPGRDRHPLGNHRRRPDDGGRHRDAARPRQPRADAGPRRRPGGPPGRQARRAVAEPEAGLTPLRRRSRHGPFAARRRRDRFARLRRRGRHAPRTT